MSEITETIYCCDRCGWRQKEKFPAYRWDASVTLSGQIGYDVAAGPGFRWKDLCERCHKYTYDLVQQIVKEMLQCREEPRHE